MEPNGHHLHKYLYIYNLFQKSAYWELHIQTEPSITKLITIIMFGGKMDLILCMNHAGPAFS